MGGVRCLTRLLLLTSVSCSSCFASVFDACRHINNSYNKRQCTLDRSVIATEPVVPEKLECPLVAFFDAEGGSGKMSHK